MALGTQDMPTTFDSQSEVLSGSMSMLSFLPIEDEKRVLVDPALWTDEERMKRELVAWAKVVAAMAVHASSKSRVSTHR
ncbi:hypothetical protein FCM35_KLT18219 [Carex littledalei]|uniref:Uncharacterized protein n=1 Tax=Carex littledalei TaxID=544730 RepID=A0A833VFE6_9POAL|nr:hypothetical protein FCM35_KLT18219 [Carex littledalei]